MKKWFALSTIVVLVLLAVTSCTININGGFATVSGTITIVGKSASGASVTVQQGSNAYGTSVILTIGGTQTGTFSISNVPFGTYAVYVDFHSASGAYSTASYLINGIGPSLLTIGGTPPNWTETIAAVSVQADTTIDTYLN